MTTYILANWKSNKTRSEAIIWLETFLDLYEPQPKLQIIIAPPSIFLDPLKQILDQHGVPQVSLAAQDISSFPKGSYTGEIAAEMVEGLVDFAIVGHSERRRYFHETPAEIARKIYEAQSVGITPILCLDRDYAIEQIAALELHMLDKDLLIGYGPANVINVETPPAPEYQQEAIAAIRKMTPDQAILYGGSITSRNAGGFLEMAEISGLMVGSASLDPHEFAEICNGVFA